jgi:PAS domain S-box-containing protein
VRAFRFGVAAAVALVEASVAIALVFTSSHDDRPWLVAVLAATAGLSFVLAGLVALWRRPENATGFFLAATGYLWFVAALTEGNDTWVWTTGFVLGNLALVSFAALVLAYPDGVLSRRDRWLVGVGGGAAILSNLGAALATERPATGCDACPPSAIAIADDASLRDAVVLAGSIVVGVVLVWVAVILTKRWRRATTAQRRTLRPVYLACGSAVALLLLAVVSDQVGSRAYSVGWVLFLIAFAAVPLTFLAGVLRSRLDRSAAARILVSLDAGVPLRTVLADVLHDPSLEIVYRLEESDRWIDELGREVEAPVASPSRSVTGIERSGRQIAAIVHDPALDSEPDLVEFIATGASLPLENVRLQAQLRAQFLFLQTVADTAPSLLVVMGTDGRILNPNKATLAASGLDDEEALRGMYFWDVFIDASERAAMIGRFRDAAPGFPPSQYENAFVNARGEQRVIEWGSAPVRDAVGRVTSIVAGGIDVTERKQREVQLQRERDITSTLMQAIPSIVVVVDREGVIVDSGVDENRAGVNEAFRAALGWPDEQLVRTSVLDLIDPSERNATRMAITAAASGVASAERESLWHRADGTDIALAWTATPVADVTLREASLVLLSGIDVTERRRQDEEIRASRARIIDAADSARRLLERNLHDGAQQRLVALSVTLRLAEARTATDPVEAAAIIRAAREELAAALEDLRELARGIHPAVLTDRGLSAAVEALVARTPLPVAVTVPHERLPAPVEAAAYYVVSEAITNIVKYAGATEIEVSIEAGDRSITVVVADDGCGGANPAAGTGLRGLRDRLAALDGTLAVESPTDRGTRIMAEIPLPSHPEAPQ